MSLLVLTLAALAFDDVQLSIPRFEATATAAAESDAGWTAIAIDGATGATSGTPWRRARTSFELPEEIESGDWLLCLGGPELELTATLNGHVLERAFDGCANVPELAAGPRFVTPKAVLQNGTNRLELAFTGIQRGRGFERGPAYLISPLPAERLRAATESRDLAIPIGNFASLATSSPEQMLVERISFKFAATRDEPRLAGQLDFAIADLERKKEMPLREFSKRRVGGAFPTVEMRAEDRLVDKSPARLQASAPVLTSPLRLSDAKAIAVELQQGTPRENFEFVWRLRFFPAVGGPLRAERGEGWVLLRNELVGFYVEGGTVLGPDDAPLGVTVILSDRVSSTHLFSLAGATARCGVVGFESGGEPDPSQADSMADLVDNLLGYDADSKLAASFFASTLGCAPFEGGNAAGIATRSCALTTFAGMRRRRNRFVYAPTAGAQSAEAFWSDTVSLLHFPVHERNAIEWLLSTQDDAGTVRGDLPDDASDFELAAADVYAVLRACRWFRWTYDGDRFLKMAPQLARALAHADGVDLVLPASVPPDREQLSTSHVLRARATAHRELAAALTQLGALEEIRAASEQAAIAQYETIARSPTATPGADPREEAFDLVYQLLDDEAEIAVASRLAAAEPAAGELDWRDVLVLRGLLQSGRVSALAKRWERLEREVLSITRPASSGVASYHGALCFGLLGFRRDDLGTVELRPRLVQKQTVRTAIRLPEGAFRFQIFDSNMKHERQVRIVNETSVDLMAVVGIPWMMGTKGQKVQNGEVVHTLFSEIVTAGATWQTLLR